MNRTLKEATVRRYHYETHQQLREHLEAFLNAGGSLPTSTSAKLGQTSRGDWMGFQPTSLRDAGDLIARDPREVSQQAWSHLARGQRQSGNGDREHGAGDTDRGRRHGAQQGAR